MIQKHTAVALGFFDGVHKGHRAVLGKAVELATENELVPCAFTFTMRGGRAGAKAGAGALMTEPEREEAILALGIERVFCPDFEEFCHMEGEAFVRELLVGRYAARAVCCGADFRFGKGARWNADDLARLCGENGAQLFVVPAVLDSGEPISSTRIRALLAQGEVQGAARLLGRPYSFAFMVQHGRKLGRTLEHPTINQPFPTGFALPRFGVYAAFAYVQGAWRPAVTNVGVKPTVQQDALPLAETYISGTDADLYGERVPVRLAAFLRPEQRFASVEELRRAIAADYARALAVCEGAQWAAQGSPETERA